jgi:hypothetical protein
MNREAVNAALGFAGNMPLTDADKTHNNLVYVFCKQLYLPTLFNALCEIDWKCARKETQLKLSQRWAVKGAGEYYYEMPADCIRPLLVDGYDNEFRTDTDFIVTARQSATLYYVFHRRSFKNLTLTTPDTQDERERGILLQRPDNSTDALDPRAFYARGGEEFSNDDDFPEWEFTPYDADFWSYFSYKLAAALVPKLRADDGAATRAQALEAIASQKGEEAIQRSRAASTNPKGQYKSWAENCGLSASPNGGSPYLRF